MSENHGVAGSIPALATNLRSMITRRLPAAAFGEGGLRLSERRLAGPARVSRSSSLTRLLPLLVVAVLASACSKPAADAAATAGEQTPLPEGAALNAPAKPVPAEIPDVVARVNGEAITKAEFERAVEALEGRAGGPVPPNQRDAIYRRVLDELVGYALLSQEANARKVTVPDAELDSRMAQIQEQFPDQAAFAKVLSERKITMETVRNDTRRDLVVARLLQSEVESKAAVKPEQIADFYAKNPDQFKESEKVRASHILISAAKDADAATKAAARARAEGILKELKSGKDFAALAKQHSQDPGSGAQGGDLGFFEQGQMVGPFNDAAFSMKPGATSGIVETDFGYHIIRVVERQEGRSVPLDEVRPQLEQFLLQQNRRDQTAAFVNGLKAKGKIEILM
jgi:peptidyl-prolyl cis-trans isomerase C